ncbi:MAG: hypothetical protein KY455_10220 [Euryarchaeota archaeon]|nr:hypothetical protein [Euryarchaeota archaeon]
MTGCEICSDPLPIDSDDTVCRQCVQDVHTAVMPAQARDHDEKARQLRLERLTELIARTPLCIALGERRLVCGHVWRRNHPLGKGGPRIHVCERDTGPRNSRRHRCPCGHTKRIERILSPRPDVQAHLDDQVREIRRQTP